VKFIHHFSDMSAPLTYLLRTSQLRKFVMMPTCFEAFETLNLRLTSAPCMIISEVSSDATFTVATYEWVLQLSYCKIREDVFIQSLNGHVNLILMSVVILIPLTTWKF
jgi:hypothetical protein